MVKIMLRNYFTIALRVIFRNRLYAAINIVCLSIGLAIFLFSQVLGDYERSYDLFFEKSDNIQVPFINIAPNGPIGIASAPVPTPARQLLEGVDGIEQISLMMVQPVVVKIDGEKFYQNVRFVEPTFFEIFNFKFLQGSGDVAVGTPNAVSISKETAEKYFPNENPLGKIITVNADHLFTITAVFDELPKNSHFSNSIMGFSGFEMAISMEGYKNITGFDGIGEWGSISTNQGMYLTLSEGASLEQVYQSIDNRFKSQVPERIQEFFIDIRFRNIEEMNLFPWEASGIPGVLVMEILGIFVLLVVVINYSNLAYAQALGRAHEVGVRKSLGASKKDIFLQFIAEGIVLSTIAGLMAIAIISTGLPFLNEAVNRNVEFNLITQPLILLLVTGTILATGIVTGFYPALILNRLTVVKILSGGSMFGNNKGWGKNILLICQLTVSVVLMTMAAVITYQNMMLGQSAERYELDNTVNIKNVRGELFDQYASLKDELLNIPGVNQVSAASQIPFEQSQDMFSLGRTRMGDDEVIVQTFAVDEGFVDIFDVDLLAGRALTRSRGDMNRNEDEDEGSINPIMINETAAKVLGWQQVDQAIGEILLPFSEESKSQFLIIGVMEDRNYSGLFGALHPMVFSMEEPDFDTISLAIIGAEYTRIMADIKRIWDQREPDYPININSLREEFDENYSVLEGINLAVATLAALAVVFSLAGLFGLSAYVAQQRTREFAIRKVMGAPVISLVKLILWQFSIPLLLSLVIGIPIAVIATDTYLELFVERVSLGGVFFAVPAVMMFILTWSVISFHAVRVTYTNPATALRSD